MVKKKPQTERSDADRRIRQCERLARLMQTLHLIMGRGRWDADALAEELNCSRRTVFRLLQTLSLAGVPWYFDERLKAYRVRPGYKFPIAKQESRSPSDIVNSSTDDVQSAAEQLLKDGETFATSLETFLTAIRTIRK